MSFVICNYAYILFQYITQRQFYNLIFLPSPWQHPSHIGVLFLSVCMFKFCSSLSIFWISKTECFRCSSLSSSLQLLTLSFLSLPSLLSLFLFHWSDIYFKMASERMRILDINTCAGFIIQPVLCYLEQSDERQMFVCLRHISHLRLQQIL